MTKNFSLPPYGLMHNRYEKEAGVGEPCPEHFLPLDASEVRERLKLKFLNDVVSDFREKYWPEWNPSVKMWEGHSIAGALAFTAVDLQLLQNFQQLLQTNVLVGNLTIYKTHADYYASEDSVDEMDKDLELYFPSMARETLTAWKGQPSSPDQLGEIEHGISSKVGYLDLHLKARFRRPRPYQTIMWFSGIDLVIQRTIRGHTPSLVGSHCMEMVFGGMTLHLSMEKVRPSEYNKQVQNGLAQYTADFGDRRIMACVHYPSDTLMTWLICFKLLPLVVREVELVSATVFLKSVIETSHLWRFLSTQNALDFYQKNSSYLQLVAEVRAKLNPS